MGYTRTVMISRETDLQCNFHTSFALLHDYYTQNVSGTGMATV